MNNPLDCVIVVHWWRNLALSSATLCATVDEAELFIENQLENNPTLDPKDYFSIHKLGKKVESSIIKKE